MNWREQPHLFANGKFKVSKGDIKIPLTHISVLGAGEFIGGNVYRILRINGCTLIARPVSDMSDEEKSKHEELSWVDYEADPEYMYYESPESLLYLLSIGVYPFEDTTDVIWRYENGK